MNLSFKYRYAHIGDRVHVAVWVSQFGPDATHTCAGRLKFSTDEWSRFRSTITSGQASLAKLKLPGCSVEFVHAY